MQLPPLVIKRGAQILPVPRLYTATRHYHDINSAEQLLVQAKAFAHLPFDLVAVHGTSDTFSGYGQAQARMAEVIGAC